MAALDDDYHSEKSVKTYLRGATNEQVAASSLSCNILKINFES